MCEVAQAVHLAGHKLSTFLLMTPHSSRAMEERYNAPATGRGEQP